MAYDASLDPNSRRNVALDRLAERTREEVEALAPCYCDQLKKLSYMRSWDQCLVCQFIDHLTEYRATEVADH
jgi:hypothetical protein